MQNRLGPGPLALLLVLACALVRIVANFYPAVLPNFTPCIAFAFIGAVYLPHRWSWLLGAAVILLSEAAFLKWDVASEGRMFSSMQLVALAFYLLVGLFGIALARRKSLAVLLAGPILGSIFFYLLANSVCWWASLHSPSGLAYAPTFAGWIQANTTGLPGYAPTWTFLRNGILGDLVFSAILIAIFEPALLTFSSASSRRTVRA